MSLTGPVKHASNPPAKGVVVLLHGLGDSGDGIAQIERYMRPYIAADLREKLAFSAPNAPYHIENDPWDWIEIGHAWFKFDFTPTGHKVFEPEVYQQSADKLVVYLSNLSNELDVPLHKFILIGFSQGAMMALYTLSKLPEQVAGVVAMAGQLLEPESTAQAAHKPPVLLLHGTADDVVSPEGSVEAHRVLTQAGFKVRLELSPGRSHNDLFDEQALEHLAAFISQALA